MVLFGNSKLYKNPQTGQMVIAIPAKIARDSQFTFKEGDRVLVTYLMEDTRVPVLVIHRLRKKGEIKKRIVPEVKLAPKRGWTYRIIVADKWGNTAFDDMKVHGKPMHRTLDRLIAEVIAKYCKIPNAKDYAFTHTHYYCDEVELPCEEG